ncbi:NAD(P)H-binding protein [Umezawaea endophytica]|uniref:NmrA family NAD(P)-binding protein n=1 Tax=Umezawaea endophytica TaxID=1654476 RepID=A0A9X2VGF8_9PSEU|nr:NAD(P)H-binding protein [Umezawaea endophytica]MCS7475674.1 NmrA family NAD(P)-binding protein [Umezawaea endophytica]
MSQPKNVLVTAATGKTGVHTTRLLLERGHHVRALVHRLDERSAHLADLGAEVAVGDLLDLASVTSATRGIDTAYFAYPIVPGLVDATAVFAEATADSGVRAIVNMSQISARRDAVSDAARQHWIAERVLDWSPVPTTHLRPTFFAEWLITFLDDRGVLRLPFADGRHAPIAAEDQAHVIAAILEDPEPHAGEVYLLRGPVELNHTEIAAELSGALGRPLSYEPISLDEFTATLEARGFGAHTVQHLRSVAVDYRNGIFAGTDDVVATVGGKVPMTVAEYAVRNEEFFEDKGSWAFW